MPTSNLIVWRHAEAEVGAPSGLDADRALTDKGHADAQRMAKWLKKQLPKDAKIYCSPALRCKQTLDGLLALRGKKNFSHVEYTQTLALESSVAAITQQLLTAPFSTILMVGHQPLLGELVAYLHSASGAESYAIKKGAVWWLRQQQSCQVVTQQSRVVAGAMELLTVQHPKLFR